MELINITEETLKDIFMVDFPSTMSLDRCREHLELAIYMKAIEMGLDPDDEESGVNISPMWVWIAVGEMLRKNAGNVICDEYVKRFGLKSNKVNQNR